MRALKFILLYCIIKFRVVFGFTSYPLSGNTTALRFKRICYYIHNGQKSTFPDRFTMETLGFHYDSIRIVGKREIDSFPDATVPLKSLWDNHANEKFLAMGQSDFIIGTPLKLFHLLNPCFIYWNNNIAISWRKEAGLIRIVLINVKMLSALNQTTSHHRHSRHSKPFSLTIKHHIAMLKHFNFYNDSLPHVEMTGEDPRLITVSKSNSLDSRNDSSSEGKETLWVAFCQRYHRANPELWMSYAEVKLSNESLTLGTTVNFNYKLESPKEQKNWSPFVTNNSELLFIQSIDPHRVVQAVKTHMPQHVFGETLHLTRSPTGNLSHIWRFGELRGGTPALPIPLPYSPPPLPTTTSHSASATSATPSPPLQPLHQWQYLSFFHSSNMPPRTGYVLQSYAMGAYTFCAEAPHKILKMSSSPIIHETMYSGNWTNLPLSFYHIDYVVFPMSFILDGNTVYLTYGKQDQEGWLVRLDLQKLLSSLRTVEDSC